MVKLQRKNPEQKIKERKRVRVKTQKIWQGRMEKGSKTGECFGTRTDGLERSRSESKEKGP